MHRIIQIIISLIIGIVLDLVLGDPQGRWHPVRAIGALISFLEERLRGAFPKDNKGEYAAGILLVAMVSGITASVVVLITFIFYRINPYLGVLVEGVLCYYMFAAKSLQCESMKVYDALSDNLDSARSAVSMIVGRDTDALTKEGVIKATVETIAENTSDGVIAPLIFAGIGGAPLLYFYKAVNTMDSMVGYKNEKYLYFGRAAAKLDDVLNFLPSRISALCMIVAAFILKGFEGKAAYIIWRRDRYNHKSPNSAQTESVMAGALGVRLAGDAYYFGQLCKKPYIGDEIREVEKEDIKRANTLMFGGSFFSLIIILAVLFVICIAR